MDARVCSSCGEKNNPQFNACWKCGVDLSVKNSNSQDASNLPENLLVHALFENSILHVQNLVRRTQNNAIVQKTATEIAGHLIEYSFVIMIFYFEASGRQDLKQKVTRKHEDFFLQNSGINDDEGEEYLSAWRQEIQRKITWLSMGNSMADFKNNIFARNILDDLGLTISGPDEIAPYIEQFIRDIQTSMKHFGIVA